MKRYGMYPRAKPDTAGSGVVSQAGGVALVETMRASGLDAALSAALAPWRKPAARHDPGKVITDLALTLALGGDCLADIGLLRAEPAVFGLVASDPTVSRTIDALAADAPRALAAIDTSRSRAWAAAWSAAGEHAPDHGASADTPVVIDVDATLVTAHSEKEQAAPTYKRGYGYPTTPPSITSRWSMQRWPNCPGTGRGPDPGARCWSVPTALGPATSS